MSSDHTIRTEVRLSGSIPATFIMGKDLDGIYIGGDFQGVAQGWYDANLPGLVPDGLWSGGINTGLPADGLWLGGVFAGVVDGYYVANVRTTLADGLWVGEQYQGGVDGWYVSNDREVLADGLWVGEVYQGVVDGFYVDNAPTAVPDGYWSGGVLGAVPDGYWQGGSVGPVPDGYWSGGSIDTVPNGVWQGGTNAGLADGWYVANLPAQVPNGLWVGGVNTGPVGDGLWAGGANTGPLSDGIYVGQAFEEVATGYYVSNVKTNIPDGCYRNGGLVDPYYERIRDAALAEGGGLYLFQLEHGQYAGEQVIWQEMGELTPWVPGLLTPQGKTYDLMGSGEYLGQSVSMRRPVDGVWDGVDSQLIASSAAVGQRLHQAKSSAIFMEVDVLSDPLLRVFWATKNSTSTGAGDGMLARGHTGDELMQYVSIASGNQPYSSASSGMGVSMGSPVSVVGSVNTGTNFGFYKDGGRFSSRDFDAYADVPALENLSIGAAPNRSVPLHARYTYIAIYTREPTPYEISLHKRTP